MAARGSFCDFGEAGEEDERVAQAGSTLAVSVLLARERREVEARGDANGGDEGECESEVEGDPADCDCALDEEAGVSRLVDDESHLELLDGTRYRV